MELFYNPERMSETEIKETFVAYQWLVDEIISILKRQPKGAGVQHVVIVAPRGMGKTTMLLMLRFTILSQDIAKRWQPVLFPEESYSVYDLADLWVEVMEHIASETGDGVLREEVKKLKDSHRDTSDLEAVALASIKDWREKNKKRLLLLVDNFDMILEQIGNEKDNASLRDILMNDGTMMFVGGSTTFFKEARAYDQPLYNLFKIYNLNGLNSDQVEDLLRRRAKVERLENFEDILRANRTRLRVLEYFTGGNPRLVLMLYRVLTHSDISEIRRGLEKLLDEVTPYYKAKIEVLPPQQRKILDQIARISAQTREGLTPTEIASATRLTVNQVSSQLKRLADVGYVRAADIRGRSSYYTLSEPLYAIWHQMRFGRDARTRMNWLIAFLKGWYDAQELGVECQRLQDAFHAYLTAGRAKEARDALDHRRYLMEGIEDQSARVRTFESVVLGYLELSDVDTLKQDLLANVDVEVLSETTRQRLLAAGLLATDAAPHPESEKVEFKKLLKGLRSALDQENNREAAKIFQDLEILLPIASPQTLLIRALSNFLLDKYEECLASVEELLSKNPRVRGAWSLRGYALKELSRFPEAVDALEHAVAIEPTFDDLYELGDALEDLGYREKALMVFDKALELEPNSFEALYGRARVLDELGRRQDALSVFDRALSLKPDSDEAWFDRGSLLARMERTDEALESFNHAIKLDPKCYYYLRGKCWALARQHRVDDALKCTNEMLQLEPESADTYFWRGLLTIATDLNSALNDLRRAFAMKSSPFRQFVDGPEGKALKLRMSITDGNVNQIRDDWTELIKYAHQKPDQILWLREISELLIVLARVGQWALAQELISSANLEEPLLPLSRALAYLSDGDESTIEKLSPEIRTVVKEIITDLRKAAGNNDTATSRKKKTNGTAKTRH